MTGAATYPKLNKDTAVDVVVVGGGITGLSVAYLVQQAGKTVAVLEQSSLASGTTGSTTGKVTSQHGLIYADLQQRLGKTAAKRYGEANQTAIEEIARVIRREKIDCDFVAADNVVFTADPDRVREFKQEAKVAAQLGLPATFDTSLGLPFPVKGAVVFADQANFNATDYVKGLAKAVVGGGGHVFENSKVIGFGKDSVRTKEATVEAADIVVATKVPTVPLVARVSYCCFEYPVTSHLISGKATFNLRGMYISPDKDHYSLLQVGKSDQRTLLIGGESHLPVFPRKEVHYERLAAYGEKYFGLESVSAKWGARDYISYDGVPLIGRVYSRRDHLYQATAYAKWGLSSSMVAAMILRDQIMGINNPWAEVFRSPRRQALYSIPRGVANFLKS